MTRNTKIGAVAAIILFLAVFVGWCANNSAKADSSEYASGVRAIRVTDHSRYIIDERFELCFYETASPYGVSVIEADCYQLMTREK